MARNKEEALKIVEDYEILLRKKGALETIPQCKFKTDSVEEFLIDFLDKNSKKGYFDNTRRIGGSKEYKDDSYRGARRSISDLFRLSLNYVGEHITLFEVMTSMYIISQLPLRVGEYEIYNNICGTILRRVFNACKPGSNISSRFNSNSISEIGGSDEADIRISDYILLCDEALQERRKIIASQERERLEKRRIDGELAKKQREEALKKQEENRLERIKNAKENAIKQKLAEINTKHLTLDEQITAKVAKMKESNHSSIGLVRIVKKKKISAFNLENYS